MKKLFVSFVISVLFVGSAYSGETLLVSAPPSIWAKKVGAKIEGPIVELIKNIAAELEVPVRTKFLPWKRAV